MPFVGEIRLFAGNFAPAGWQFCNGAILAISQNDTLFNLIGTTYGGDGQSTFAVPDLRGRVPVHQGQGTGLSNYVIGEQLGVEMQTVTAQQLPLHSHALVASKAGGQAAGPENKVLASPPGVTPFIQDIPTVALAATSVTAAGGSQPHENLMPYGCVSYIISLFGTFPSPT